MTGKLAKRLVLASIVLVSQAMAVPKHQQLPDLKLYQAVLDQYVHPDGRVDYAGIRRNSGPLEQFVAQIAAISPDSAPAAFVGEAARLSYWINAYNALVLYAFAREYPEKRNRLHGIIGRAHFFYKMQHRVGGRLRSLANIEDAKIRSMGDPRIHFVIVCASKSCPWLSRTAFTPANLKQQLETETQRYWAQTRNFRLDEGTGEVWLPKILDWFRSDFGGTPAAIQGFVARYRPGNRERLLTMTNRIRYFEYDWSPNDIR